MRSFPRAQEPVDFADATAVDLAFFSVGKIVRLADAETRKIISHPDCKINGLS